MTNGDIIAYSLYGISILGLLVGLLVSLWTQKKTVSAVYFVLLMVQLEFLTFKYQITKIKQTRASDLQALTNEVQAFMTTIKSVTSAKSNK